MSKTDKTRPYRLKRADAESADPFGFRREAFVAWRPEYRCGHTCSCSSDWYLQDKSRRRRERKDAARNWQREWA